MALPHIVQLLFIGCERKKRAAWEMGLKVEGSMLSRGRRKSIIGSSVFFPAVHHTVAVSKLPLEYISKSKVSKDSYCMTAT